MSAPDVWRVRRVWRDLPLRRKGVIVATIPLVPLLVTTTLLFVSHERERRAQAAVERALAVKEELLRVFTLVMDAESSLRGYLLTNSREFLESYRRAVDLSGQSLAALNAIVQDADQRVRLTRLEQLVEHRFALMRDFAAAQTAGRRAQPEEVQVARRRMEAVRATMDEMEREEDELTARRQARAAREGRLVLGVAAGGMLFGIAGGIAAAFLFSAGVAQRVDQVRENADRLARRQPLLPVLEGRDEVAQLGDRVQHAADLLVEREADLQRRMDELATVNKELEAFSYSVSHDLRAPLRHVAGFAALLQRTAEARLEEKERRYLRTIIDAAARMGRLVDDLLSFSRMGRTEMLRSTVSLDDVVDDVIADEMRGVTGRQIEWRRHPLPSVRADRAMLRVALANLVSNAIKYTAPRERAVIEIGVSPGRHGEAVLFVRDNGVGFDMAYADKLFGVFQRLHSADEFEGTGIGLANVGRIVHRHGGRAWAEGEPGKGATFYVALPAAEAAA